MNDRDSISARKGNFPHRHRVHTGSGAHLVSYPMGTGDPYTYGKAVVT